MTAPPRGLYVDIDLQRNGFRLQASLEAEPGVLVLFGPSGAGKSTTLQAIAGLVTPTAGEIVLGGELLFRRHRTGPEANLPARARRAGYVFQDYALFPHLTALDNVAFSLGRRPEARSVALAQLESFDLAELADRLPQELSGGQQQRVAIARALVARPRVLLLDEPFAALDLETRRRARGEIRRILAVSELPVVLVTHDREEALALGDRVAILDQGRVLLQGDPVSVLGHTPRERVARLMGVENVWQLEVREVIPQEGILRCGRGGLQIEVPLTEARQGETISVGVRADHVLLATERPRGLSARNQLLGTVLSIEPRGALCAVSLDCQGLPVLVHVTPRTVAELPIAQGAEVWAVIKTASCSVLVG
jgi:molybdate transport system ATP-binding protein